MSSRYRIFNFKFLVFLITTFEIVLSLRIQLFTHQPKVINKENVLNQDIDKKNWTVLEWYWYETQYLLDDFPHVP